jgi:hypothetical protein
MIVIWQNIATWPNNASVIQTFFSYVHLPLHHGVRQNIATWPNNASVIQTFFSYVHLPLHHGVRPLLLPLSASEQITRVNSKVVNNQLL